jgi:hypothetical protein
MTGRLGGAASAAQFQPAQPDPLISPERWHVTETGEHSGLLSIDVRIRGSLGRFCAQLA